MGKGNITRRERRLARREAKAARKLAGPKKALGQMRTSSPREPGSGPEDDGLFDDCPICLALRALEANGATRRVALPEMLVHELGELGIDVIASEPGALRSRAS